MSLSTSISSQISVISGSGILEAFNHAAFFSGVDRNLLLAIASRESNMGLSLDSNYLGDSGNAIGIMQIDRRYHPQFAARVSPDDHQAVILKGAWILREAIREFPENLDAAIAAYNAGISRVRSALQAGSHPDSVTTGRNYASDVLTRKTLIDQLIGDYRPIIPNLATGSLLALALLSAAAYSFITWQRQ